MTDAWAEHERIIWHCDGNNTSVSLLSLELWKKEQRVAELELLVGTLRGGISEARAELVAALMQTKDTDDQIIIGHIRSAVAVLKFIGDQK